jgi:trimethylamine--corrinoid protein Co-methyltransferase
MRLSTPQVLSQDELEIIHQTSLNILADVGIQVDGEQLRQRLVDAGAKVDFQSGLLKISHDLVMHALETTPRRITLFSRDGRPTITLGDGRSYCGIGQGAIYFEDTSQGKRRLATKEDVANLFRLGDAMPLVSLVAPPAIPNDVPPETCYAHAADAAWNNSAKHLEINPETARVARILLDMARVVAGTDDLASRPILTCLVSVQSPLHWPEHLCDSVLALVSAGVPIIFHCAPLFGVSGPVTLAGLLAQQNAEVLSGIVISQIIRPGTPVIYGGGWGSFDLRTMTRVLGSPEGALLRMAGGQIGRFYGVPNHSLGPDSDSQAMDEQMGWEKMLSAIAAINAGISIFINTSMYGQGMTVSYEQLILDQEIVGMAYRFLEGITVSPETLAYDVIKSVGPHGSFLMEEHTLKYMRSGEHWLPTLSNRRGYDQWKEKGGKDIVQQATERARQILETHQPEPLDTYVRQELHKIITSAGTSS